MGKIKSHISLTNANITFLLTGYSCLTMFLKFDIFQGHGTKVKVTRSPGALTTKTAVTLPCFEVLRRNKTEMYGEQISFVAM